MKYIFSVSFLIVLIFTSCKHGHGEYHSLYDKIQAESIIHQDSTLSSEAFFRHYKTMEITEGGHTFLIPERKSQIASFACTECHTGPLDKLKDKDLKKAHWDITLAHANDNIMNCATCHNGNDMNNLHTLTGKSIDFNSSYKLCAQCHTSQFKDWKGGAHGKRIGGWAPPRASLTCVNCHNPHNPSIESRWPSRFNTEQIEESYEDLEH